MSVNPAKRPRANTAGEGHPSVGREPEVPDRILKDIIDSLDSVTHRKLLFQAAKQDPTLAREISCAPQKSGYGNRLLVFWADIVRLLGEHRYGTSEEQYKAAGEVYAYLTDVIQRVVEGADTTDTPIHVIESAAGKLVRMSLAVCGSDTPVSKEIWKRLHLSQLSIALRKVLHVKSGLEGTATDPAKLKLVKRWYLSGTLPNADVSFRHAMELLGLEETENGARLKESKEDEIEPENPKHDEGIPDEGNQKRSDKDHGTNGQDNKTEQRKDEGSKNEDNGNDSSKVADTEDEAHKDENDTERAEDGADDDRKGIEAEKGVKS